MTDEETLKTYQDQGGCVAHLQDDVDDHDCDDWTNWDALEAICLVCGATVSSDHMGTGGEPNR